MSSPLTILGIDFTSAPKARKPITCVRMSLEGHEIEFEALERWNSFHGFEQMLAADGPWSRKSKTIESRIVGFSASHRSRMRWYRISWQICGKGSTNFDQLDAEENKSVEYFRRVVYCL